MPYCVRCGVQLDKSAKKCVLCNTEVMLLSEGEAPPYPKEKAETAQYNTHFAALFLSLFLLIPNITVLIINLIYFNGIYWMYYVFGGSLVIWVIFLLPMMFNRKRPFMHICFIFISVTLYLFLIALAVSGIDWFLQLALPICITISILLVSLIYIVKFKKPGRLIITAVSLVDIILLCITIEIVVSYYIHQDIHLSWSYVVAGSVIPVVIGLVLLSGNKKAQDELIKKLHL